MRHGALPPQHYFSKKIPKKRYLEARLISAMDDLFSYPGLIFLSEWWVERRGFAGSVMFAGGPVFGLVYLPVVEWSLKNYGTPITYRAFAVVWLIVLLPILPFFSGRPTMTPRRQTNTLYMSRYLRRPLFWALMIITLIQSLGFFVPSLYMPSYAKSMGLPNGGVVLVIFSAASVFGQLLIGTVSDHFDISWLIGITSICSATSIFGLWGRCNGFPMLASFAVIFGLSAGGFSCLWQRFAMLVAPSEPKSGNLIAFFATSRGVANVLTGPIAGALVQSGGSGPEAFQKLVYYSGTLMLISSIGAGIRVFYGGIVD